MRLSQDQFTLGQLIDALKPFADDESVCLDFARFEVGRLCSYRGFYEDLAIVVAENGSGSVGALRALLAASVNSTEHGWKGGEYRMTRETALWVVADPSRTSDTIITGVEREGEYTGAVVCTRRMPH